VHFVLFFLVYYSYCAEEIETVCILLWLLCVSICAENEVYRAVFASRSLEETIVGRAVTFTTNAAAFVVAQFLQSWFNNVAF